MGGLWRARMSEAGLSLETSTRRGGVVREGGREEVMRVRIEVREVVRWVVRVGEGLMEGIGGLGGEEVMVVG